MKKSSRLFFAIVVAYVAFKILSGIFSIGFMAILSSFVTLVIVGGSSVLLHRKFNCHAFVWKSANLKLSKQNETHRTNDTGILEN